MRNYGLSVKMPLAGNAMTSSAVSNFLYGVVARTALIKRLQPRLRPAQNQRMHIVRAFIGIDGF